MNFYDVGCIVSLSLFSIQPFMDLYHVLFHPKDCGKEDCEPCRYFAAPRYLPVLVGNVKQAVDQDCANVVTNAQANEYGGGGQGEIQGVSNLNTHFSSSKKFKILSSLRDVLTDAGFSFYLGMVFGLCLLGSLTQPAGFF